MSTKGTEGQFPSEFDPLSRWNQIRTAVDDLFAKSSGCSCICIVGYSWGGGQAKHLADYMNSNYPKTRRPYGATIDAILNLPALFDTFRTALWNRMPVDYHEHWYAEFDVATIKGGHIPTIAPGTSTFQPGTTHTSIQDIRTKSGQGIVATITASVLDRCWLS